MKRSIASRPVRCAALAAALAAAVVTAASPPAGAADVHVAAHYALTDLGPLQGGGTSQAAGLNSKGVAVGYSDDGACRRHHKAWTAAGSVPAIARGTGPPEGVRSGQRRVRSGLASISAPASVSQPA